MIRRLEERHLGSREEKDSMGVVSVPDNVFWGAQTARSLKNFKIGKNTFSKEMIWALALIKNLQLKLTWI